MNTKSFLKNSHYCLQGLHRAVTLTDIGESDDMALSHSSACGLVVGQAKCFVNHVHDRLIVTGNLSDDMEGFD